MTSTTTPKSGARPAAAITTWKTAPTKHVDVGGTPFAYRELGPRAGVPLVFLHHFTAVLDDWDPRVIDGIAAERHVIAFDNRGIGAIGRIGAAHHRGDGRRCRRLHPRPRPRPGRPARLLPRRRRRAGDHARAPRARPPGRSSPAPVPPAVAASRRSRRSRPPRTSRPRSRCAIPGTSCSSPGRPTASAPPPTTWPG